MPLNIGVCALADPESRALWFDASRVESSSDVPRHARWSGRVLYATADVADSDLSRLMRNADRAWGPSHGKVSVLRFACSGGGYYVVRSDAWGVDSPDPSEASLQIAALQRLAEQCGIPPQRTASATARKLYQSSLFGGSEWCQALAPQWRGLAHAAVHGGPALCVAGGTGKHGNPAACVDMRSAYWHALCEPMPVLGRIPGGNKEGRYVAYSGPWEAIRERTGIAECAVRVTGPRGIGAIPPLPVQVGGYFAYPLGEFVGTWEIAHIREAEERGEVEVTNVIQAMLSNVRIPLFKPFMQWLKDNAPSELTKLLYTRFYGMLVTRGGWEASVNEHTGEVQWQSQKVQPMEPAAPSTYRPDIGAIVTGHSHRTVMAALRTLDERQTIAIHVDAVWTHDTVGAENLDPERWSIKKHGNVRYYGTGVYVFWPLHWEGDRPRPAECVTAGSSGIHTPETLANLARMDHTPNTLGRAWRDGYTWDSAHATSEPSVHVSQTSRSSIMFPEVTDNRWRKGRWNGKRNAS